MASDIGARMSVSGIASFKSAMSQAKSSVKALDAELKLSAAQYKASGDAEEYMADRSRILAQQIRAQEDVVSNAQKALETMASQGVDKASTAYTQMQAALAKAKTDLVTMQTEAGKTGTEMERAADSGQQMAESLQSIDKGTRLKNLSDSLSKVDGFLTGILEKALSIGKTIWDWGRDASDWADDLATNASMAGMDVETYQRWQYAAQLVDTSVDDIVKATDKLMQKTKDADEGVALIESSTGQWGIRIKDANGQLRDQTDIFWDFLDVLEQVDNETERNALAQEYFGKSYRELIPLIRAGREGWEEAAAAADVVTEGNVNNLTDLNDKLQEMDQKWQTTKMTLLAQLAPAFEKVADALEYVMDLLREWAESEEGQQAISSIGDSIATLIHNLATGDLFQNMFDGATKAIKTIADFLQSITSGDIINGLETIAAIIGGIKLASTTVTGLNLLHSLGWIGAGRGAAAGASAAAAGTAYSTPLLLRGARGAGNGLLGYSLGTDMGMSQGEATGWGTAAGIGSLLNPWLGATILATEIAVGGHTANDEAIDKYRKGGAYRGKDLYAAHDFQGWQLTSANPENEAITGSNLLWLRESAEEAARMEKIMGERGGYDQYGFYDWKDPLTMLNEYEEGMIDQMAPTYGLYRNKQSDRDAVLAWIDESGQFYTQYIEDVGKWLDETSAAMDEYDQNLTQADTPADAMQQSAEETTDAAAQAGAEIGQQLTDGALEQANAAFSAGVALASAFVQGASSVGAPGGGGSSTYNSSYVNAVNFYGAMSAADIANAYRTFTQAQQAGYGG